MSPLATIEPNRLPDQADDVTAHRPVRPSNASASLVRPRTAWPAAEQCILAVEFLSLDGRTWKAIGGGDTVAEAITFARQSCPDDTTWLPLDRDNLYGD